MLININSNSALFLLQPLGFKAKSRRSFKKANKVLTAKGKVPSVSAISR